jgi:hypothetical protein
MANARSLVSTVFARTLSLWRKDERPLDAMLKKSDLLMARDWIANMHNAGNAEAEKQGGQYYWAPEYVVAWEAFRDHPSVETARRLLKVAPHLTRLFEYWAADEWTRAANGLDLLRTRR